jgi:hypothetical protein
VVRGYEPQLKNTGPSNDRFITSGPSNDRFITSGLLTLATIAVEAPSFAAATHWFAPLPPKPFLNSVPWRVSPGLGRRGVKLKQGKSCITHLNFPQDVISNL